MKFDSNLLNPFVFQKLQAIELMGPINMIDGKSLNSINDIQQITFESEYFVDMIRKNGINWIRDLNPHINVNLSNITDIAYTFYNKIQLKLRPENYITEHHFFKLFRDEDFCLYKDLPFNQLVVLMYEVVVSFTFDTELREFYSKRNYTCTYLWIAQYFRTFLRLYDV